MIGYLGYGLEIFDVAIIVIGAVSAVARFGYSHIISRGDEPYNEFRQMMGRGE